MVSNKWDAVNKWIKDQIPSSIPVHNIPASYVNRSGIQWDVLRTDMIHPICSGNKLFKLKYYLLEAAQKNYTMIHTEGGPWSNHIVAAAFAAKETGFSAKGIIHGDEPSEKSNSLLDADQYGMKLFYEGWGKKNSAPHLSESSYPIPQGGFGLLGAKGAQEMLPEELAAQYTHIICAVGTGTMLAGICKASKEKSVIGIPVLKHQTIHESIEPLLNGESFTLNHDYHFGGYAKKTNELLQFMNSFYRNTNIPTDFVYTGKLMYAVHDMIQKNMFPVGSKLLAIHSGGLQGNRSLTKAELIF